MMNARYILLSVTALLLAGALMTSCDRNEDDITSSGQQQPDNTGGNALCIVAAKQPFMDETGTRAITDFDGTYTTTFGNGDQIGVIAVKNGAVLADCNNVKLTYNATGGKWEGNDVFFVDGATYIAYSPYRAVMNGKKSAQEILDAFEVAADQSTESLFAANDLMTANGTANKTAKTITFAFTHRMAMMEISAACKQMYARTTDGWVYLLKGGALSTSSMKVNDVSIRFLKDAAADAPYRCLLKPGTSIKFSLGYMLRNKDGMGSLITYTMNNNTFIAGQRRKIFLTKERDLAIGDYYYDDGSIFPSNMAAILSGSPPTEGCIGVVFKVGTGEGDNIGNYSGSGLKDGIHGYVVALNNAEGSNVTWGGWVETGTSGSKTNFLGYSNTRKIQAMSGYGESSYKACWRATGYPVTAPTCSSGWFLPSIGQLCTMYENKSVLNTALSQVGGTGLSNVIWSSSEYSARLVWVINFSWMNAELTTIDKSTTNPVRSVLTF